MDRQKVLKGVNTVIAINFICLIATASLSGIIPRNVFVIHPLLGVIFFACVTVHVFLNWAWVKNNLLRKTGK